MRGNVLDLAVAVIIGAAFAAIVKSLTDDIIMPIVGALTGGLDFNNYYVVLGKIPAKLAGTADYETLKKAGVPLLGYGAFITSCVSFLILAAIIFMLIRIVERAFRVAMAAKEATPATPEDVILLREIRDELRARPR